MSVIAKKDMGKKVIRKHAKETGDDTLWHPYRDLLDAREDTEEHKRADK